jgi:hypothetical protein
MAQGHKLKYNKKKSAAHQKRKCAPVEEVDRERLECVRTMKKTIKKAQAKIYRNIEEKIIAKAKSKRANFELI